MMKKILAGCLAAAMLCGGMAVAEAPGGNSLRDKISAAGAGQATIELETAPGFMIPEAVDTETNIMVPEAVEEEPVVVPESVQTRKPGSLMGQINAVKQGESASVGIIGGADGPTNIYVDLPEEDEAIEIIGGQDGPTVSFVATPEPVAAPEPVAVPEIAENIAAEPVPVEEEAPLAFVLRDSITWDSTIDEIEELFEGYEGTGYPIENLLLEVFAAEVYNVKVSLFEGDMFFYFYEDRLWAMGYNLDFNDGEADKLEASLTTKYGAPTMGAAVMMDIVNPISTESMKIEENEYEIYANWTAPQNTAVVFARDEFNGMLGYFNMDYVEQMHAAVAVDEFFGI